MLFTGRMLAVVLGGLFAAGAVVADMVGVPGSDTAYPTPMETRIGDKQVKLVLTGTALRKKFVFKVYSIASYLQEGVAVHSAEELAASDSAKELHLVMERDLDGKEFVAAFTASIRANYPEPQFADELKMLSDLLLPTSVKEGDRIVLTNVPGVGLHAHILGKTEFEIKNPAFSKAVWDIYLGPNNIGEGVKKGLTSRL